MLLALLALLVVVVGAAVRGATERYSKKDGCDDGDVECSLGVSRLGVARKGAASVAQSGAECRRIYPEAATSGLVLAIGGAYATVDSDGKLRITGDRRAAVPLVFEQERPWSYALRHAGRYVALDAGLGSFDTRAVFAVRSLGGNLVAISPLSATSTGLVCVGETTVRLQTRGNDPTFDVCHDGERRKTVVEAREKATLERMRDTSRDTSCDKVVLPCTADDRVRYPSCCALE